MADENETPTKSASNTETGANATHGDHDRVQLLSLNADGTPRQLNPELIGDKDATLAATKEQFKQQAVSAVDVAERAPAPVGVEDAPQDPYVEALKAKHDEAADAAEKAAEKAVEGLSSR